MGLHHNVGQRTKWMILGQRLFGVNVEAGAGDSASFRRKKLCHCLADVSSRAGDHCDLAF